MITATTVVAWLSSYAGGLLIKLLLDGFSAWLGSRQASRAEREAGAAEAKLDQANRSIAAQQAELEAQANAPRDEDQAIKRLEEGSA